MGGIAAGPAIAIQTQIALLPANERLVVASDQIIDAQVLSPVASTSDAIVEYSYKRSVSQPLPREVISLRTPISTTQQIGNSNQYVASFTGPEFYQENGVWYDLGFATTTQSAYQLQRQSLFPLLGASTDTFSTSGSWTAPANVCQVQVDAWAASGGGGGAGNGGDGGSGGGGGAYSQLTAFAVTAGNVYALSVGIGGGHGIVGVSSGKTGGDSMFSASSTLLAKGGGGGSNGGANSGPGGAAASGHGDITTSGGDGTIGPGGTNRGGSGGGGSGGDTTDGLAGSSGGATTGGPGGTAGTTNGTAGATGGNQSAAGGNGSSPGGGGGGGGATTNSNGGDGARGEVDVIYTLGQGCAVPTTPLNNPTVLIRGGKVQIRGGSIIIK